MADQSRSGSQEEKEGDGTGVWSLSDTSPFVELFGTRTRVEIIDVLLRNPGLELEASEIAELIGRHPSSFHRQKKVLKEIGILEKSREVGPTSLYKLKQSELAKQLRKAQAELIQSGQTVSEIEDAVDEGIEERSREPSPPDTELLPERIDVAETIRGELKEIER